MLKRTLPLVLALAVAGAPLAALACELACVSMMAHPAMASAAHDTHHSCHDDGAARGVRLSQVPHACHHGDELASPSTLSAARDSSPEVPLALIAASIPTVARPSTASFLPPIDARAPLCSNLQTAVPLRI